jgi:hypothetical protein
MIERKSERQKWSDKDTEALFASIGRYVMIFQWVEGLLDQMLLLGWDYENWPESQAKLARMRFFDKVEAVKSLVLSSADFVRARSRPGWLSNFEVLIQRVHEERRRRNALLHSQFLFEFVEAGLPPVRSLRKGTPNGGSTFDQQYFTPEAQEQLVADLIQLGLDVNFTFVQLIHDHRAPLKSENGEDDLKEDDPGIGAKLSHYFRQFWQK